MANASDRPMQPVLGNPLRAAVVADVNGDGRVIVVLLLATLLFPASAEASGSGGTVAPTASGLTAKARATRANAATTSAALTPTPT